MMRSLLLMSCLALPVVAQNPSAAEAAYRDAWWAETGENDLDTALRGYLAAAGADGPRQIRGKALLAAGCVQQRLGKTDSAIHSFRQLLEQHADDVELTERAHAHLRELTAVDLRQGYDEWYEKRLFGEVVQLQILDKVEELARVAEMPSGMEKEERRAFEQRRDQLCAEITAFGPGAVPALQKASTSANPGLARLCTKLLVRMGEIPPAAALARTFYTWGDETEAWLALLRLPRAKRDALLADLPKAFEGRSLVVAALRGPNALVEALRRCEEMRMLRESPEFVGAIGRASLVADDSARAAVLALTVDEDAPRAVRNGLEWLFLESDWDLPIGPAEWLALGRDPINFELRDAAVAGCMRKLRADDGELLDEAIARLANSILPADMLENSCSSFANGLEANGFRDVLPWTAARLRAVLMLPCIGDGLADGMIRPCRGRERTRRLLADALLMDPAPLHAHFGAAPSVDLDMLFELNADDERQGYLDQTRWCQALAGSLEQHWSGMDEQGRLASLAILVDVVDQQQGDRSALLEQLERYREGVGEPLAAALQQTIEALRGE